MKKIIISLFSACILLCSCNLPDRSSSLSEQQTETTTVTVTSQTTQTTTAEITTTTTTSLSTTTTTTTTTATTAEPFDLSEVPEYSGSPYVEVNGNKPYFTDYPTEIFETYSPLDSLGRCGVAYALISKETMPRTERESIGAVKPSGWHTANYKGIIEDIYLYNRCHLIGYQLAGENANEKNLITGTRYMNVEGMEPFENKVANYVKSHNARVLYRVTPIFEGNNLVASGVLMEAYSIDDSGTGIQFCVYCYNVQPNIAIDYATGDSHALVEPVVTITVQAEPPKAISEKEEKQIADCDYILNTNSKKFHYPSCSSVDTMAEHNTEYFTGSRDDVIAMGYEPCKRCNP